MKMTRMIFAALVVAVFLSVRASAGHQQSCDNGDCTSVTPPSLPIGSPALAPGPNSNPVNCSIVTYSDPRCFSSKANDGNPPAPSTPEGLPPPVFVTRVPIGTATPPSGTAPTAQPGAGGPPDGGNDLGVDPGKALSGGAGSRGGLPTVAAAQGSILGEIQTSAVNAPADRSGLGRTARALQAMLNAPLPERARQAGVDPREIQALLGRKVGQIAGPLDAEATARKYAHDKLFNNALTKLKLKDWRGALDDLAALLTNDPADALALEKRAEAENHLGLYKEAELDARKALVLDPNNASAWQQLAWALLKQGRYQEALEAINRALVLDPNNANNYAIRSYIKEALGDRKGAIEDLEKAALLDANYRGMLEQARQGGRIYNPDQDQDSVKDMVSSAFGGSRLPLTLIAFAALLLLAVVGAMLYRFGRAETERKLRALTPWAPRPAVSTSPTGAPMIGKYELGPVIGKGGMGEVYAAKDLSLNRPVAIKKLANIPPEFGEQGRQLFVKEAKMVASLHHPSIVDIYDIIERDNEIYLVFEFVGGKTVSQLIVEKGRLTAPQALAILKPVCRALAFAHHHNLVHRDLKPANIMITDQGHHKLMDFGIARSLADPSSTAGSQAAPEARPEPFARTRTVMGTPSYMPPESDSGIVSKQGDVYSLGVTLYEMVTGKLPFSANADVIEKAQMRYAPATTLVPSLPPGIDSLLKDALQPDRNRRMQTPIEFLARLKAVVGEAVTPF